VRRSLVVWLTFSTTAVRKFFTSREWMSAKATSTKSPSAQLTQARSAADPIVVTHREARVDMPKTASPAGIGIGPAPPAFASRAR